MQFSVIEIKVNKLNGTDSYIKCIGYLVIITRN